MEEALGLHWNSINLPNRTLRVRRITVRTSDPENRMQIQDHPKTGAGIRTLPLAVPVREMLERRKGESDNDLALPNKKGRPVFSSTATRPISKAFKSLGIKGTAHGLRHGAVTHMLETGAPLNAVAKLAGHENTDVTARVYLAWSDNESAIEAMRKAMGD